MNKHSLLTIFLFALLLSLCLTHSAYAQTDIPGARKFDEFGDVPLSDIAARLDNFANELQNQPNMRAFLIAYRSQRDLPGLSGRLVNWLKNYLLYHGFPPARIVAVDGGVAGCVVQELWLVPVGATPKPRSDAYSTQFEDTNSARKYDEGYLPSERDFNESYTTSIEDSLEGFADALRREPKSLGYIIAYTQYRIDQWDEYDKRGGKITRRRVLIDPVGSAQKEMARKKDALVKKYDIPSARLRLVNGGYRKWRSMELWIVPKGEHAPIPTPNSFPKGRR